MNFTKATNEQIKTIIESDENLPTPLLKEVYEESMNRDIFRPKIVHHIIKLFGSKEKAEQKTGLDVEDLIWICYESGYEIIGCYELTKPFAGLWHTVMTNEILMIIQKQSALKRKADVYPLDELHEWSVPRGNNTEPIALARIQIEQIMSQLTETEKEIVIKRYQGYTLHEIGEMQNISSRTIFKRIKTYQKRLKGA